MCVHMYMCIVCVCVYIDRYTFMYYVYMCSYMCVYIYAYVCLCMHMCVYVYLHVYICVYVHIWEILKQVFLEEFANSNFHAVEGTIHYISSLHV